MAVAILLGASFYAAIGGVLGMFFVWRGIERVDPAAHGAPWSFRLLVLPGAMALWPLLTVRWIRALQARGGR
jgi:hypothetical protein